jgi:hypothetical protein
MGSPTVRNLRFVLWDALGSRLPLGHPVHTWHSCNLVCSASLNTAQQLREQFRRRVRARRAQLALKASASA